jgi:protein SCO1
MSPILPDNPHSPHSPHPPHPPRSNLDRRAAARRGALAWLVGNPFFWLLVVGGLFAAPIARSVGRRLTAAPAILGALPTFALTDQAGRSFGTRELTGKVWVTDFIFTACQEACPLLSLRMQELGHRTRHLGPDFHLVSISVDPDRDTPERLAAYAARYGANPVRWSFLTGPADAIQAAVTGGFKVGMGREAVSGTGAAADGGRAEGDSAAADSFWQIFHGENLVLVDRQLRIRGYFPATPDGLDRLVEAIGRVVNGA